MNKNSKIYVAGHNGMVGSAIVRNLQSKGYTHIITRTRAELDLCNQQLVNEFFQKEKPEYTVLAAAKVGGIQANNVQRADFIYENLIVEANVTHAVAQLKKEKDQTPAQYGEFRKEPKLLFLGSSCIYPKLAPQPLKEEYLLTSPLEPTNEPYAIAKIAGIKLCESYRRQYGCNFISVMPTNLYGPNDNYDPQSSHVLPALLRKFHTAKVSGVSSVELWGTGEALREFMHVDDLAEACVMLLETYDEEDIVNMGVGEDLTIKDLAHIIKDVVGFEREIMFDTTKPNGTPRKLLDVSKLNKIGFKPKISLKKGIARTYKEILEQKIFE